MGDAHMAMQARLMSQALRKLSHSLSQSQCILLFLNQVRAKISTFGYGGPTEVTCGGNALKFYASVRLNIRRTGLVKKGEETVGSQVLVKVIKNKHAPPFRTADFELEFGKGICRDAELISLGVKYKLVKKNGAMYSLNGETFRGKDALRKYFAENSTVRDELELIIKEKLYSTEAPEEEVTEETVSPDSTDEGVTAAEA
ncbi:hypothetical protein KSS87_005242 [Heliosperma pusillum]|nr:hypothetical protein KSS87_005242 [Heliosperma pusillum]